MRLRTNSWLSTFVACSTLATEAPSGALPCPASRCLSSSISSCFSRTIESVARITFSICTVLGAATVVLIVVVLLEALQQLPLGASQSSGWPGTATTRGPVATFFANSSFCFLSSRYRAWPYHTAGSGRPARGRCHRWSCRRLPGPQRQVAPRPRPDDATASRVPRSASRPTPELWIRRRPKWPSRPNVTPARGRKSFQRPLQLHCPGLLCLKALRCRRGACLGVGAVTHGFIDAGFGLRVARPAGSLAPQPRRQVHRRAVRNCLRSRSQSRRASASRAS